MANDAYECTIGSIIVFPANRLIGADRTTTISLQRGAEGLWVGVTQDQTCPGDGIAITIETWPMVLGAIETMLGVCRVRSGVQHHASECAGMSPCESSVDE